MGYVQSLYTEREYIEKHNYKLKSTFKKKGIGYMYFGG
jgi:hypothetical protein